MIERFNHADGFNPEQPKKNGARGFPDKNLVQMKEPKSERVEVSWEEPENPDGAVDVNIVEGTLSKNKERNEKAESTAALIEKWKVVTEHMKTAIDQHQAILKSLSDISADEHAILEQMDRESALYEDLEREHPEESDMLDEKKEILGRILGLLASQKGFEIERERVKNVLTITERAMTEHYIEIEQIHKKFLEIDGSSVEHDPSRN